jgi:hypothetical protein
MLDILPHGDAAAVGGFLASRLTAILADGTYISAAVEQSPRHDLDEAGSSLHSPGVNCRPFSLLAPATVSKQSAWSWG